jgi:opacity protein-like surface antigen
MRFGLKTTAIALATFFLSGQANAADIYRGDTGGSLKDAPYAAPPSLYYFAIRGGATFPDDTDFDINADLGDFSLGITDNIKNQYDDVGFIVSGAFGISMSSLSGLNGLRGELEIGYFQNEIDAHKVTFVGGASATIGGADAFGETSAVFGLANLYYDFNQFGWFKPFIGGGIGAAAVDFSNHAVNLDGPGLGEVTKVTALDDNDVGFAYQLSGGANFAISDRVDLEIGYRYLGITGIDLKAVDGTKSSIDVDNHVVYGGLRFKM